VAGGADRVDRQERGARDARRALCARRTGARRRDPAADDRARHAERAAPAARGRCRALCGRVGRRGGGGQPRARRGRRRGGRGRIRAAAVRARRRGGVPARQPAGAPSARLERAARPELRVGRGRQGLCRELASTGAEGAMGTQRHRADRDVRPGRGVGPVARDPRCLRVDPDAEISRADRRRAQAAGLGRAGASRRRRRRQLRGQARHQAHRGGRLSDAPARLPGAADRGPPGEHARRRRARPGAQFRRRGRA
jgi:hypothetical protein